MSEFPHIHPAYKKQLPFWVKWRDAVQGEDAIKEKKEVYLPRLFAQSPEEYAQYLRGATYYNATGKTVDALSSAPFRKEAALALPKIETLKDDACPHQTLSELQQHASEELWTVGRCGLLSDFDQEGTPQVYLYTAESIVNWRVVEDELVFVILCETYEKESKDSPYVFETAKQYRFLELGTLAEGGPVYRQRVMRLVKDTTGKEEWAEVPELTVYPVQAGGEGLAFIPFTFLNFETEGVAVGGSPIVDLANINLKHYVGTADVENILHLACAPFLQVIGLEQTERPKKFPVGSSTVLYLDPVPGVGASWIVCSSDGAKPRQEDLRIKEDQMARMGGSFLRAQKKEAETAESMRIQQSGESSVLTKITNALSKGFTQAARFLAKWLGEDESKVSITLSNEFFDIKIEQWEADLLIQLYQTGLISKEQLFEGLQGGGILKKEWLQAAMKARTDGSIKEEAKRSTGPIDRAVLQGTGQ
jgi:Domain of unknown function (DUF4055)